jgi:ribonuclease HIII
MDPLVIKINPAQLDELRVTLLDHDYTHKAHTTNEYEDFRVTHSGGVIIGYKTGKIVANGAACIRLLKEIVSRMDTETACDITIGSDEAGKGEWLGPMTVAAVALSPDQIVYLQSAGVMDSKELTTEVIGNLAFEVEDNCLAHAEVVIPPAKFEARLQEMKEEGKNLNDLLAWGHAKVISEVYRKIQTKNRSVQVVIDEFDAKKMQKRLGEALDLGSVELVQRHGAEDNIAVAAASILARDAREEWIDKASLKLGVQLEGLSKKEAMKRSDLKEFAKLSYLK